MLKGEHEHVDVSVEVSCGNSGRRSKWISLTTATPNPASGSVEHLGHVRVKRVAFRVEVESYSSRASVSSNPAISTTGGLLHGGPVRRSPQSVDRLAPPDVDRRHRACVRDARSRRWMCFAPTVRVPVPPTTLRRVDYECALQSNSTAFIALFSPTVAPADESTEDTAKRESSRLIGSKDRTPEGCGGLGQLHDWSRHSEVENVGSGGAGLRFPRRYRAPRT